MDKHSTGGVGAIGTRLRRRAGEVVAALSWSEEPVKAPPLIYAVLGP